MLTMAGPMCDVCGNFIFGILPDDKMATFKVAGCESTLLAHTIKCLAALEGCGTDWNALPEGPLKQMFRAADERMRKGDSH